MAQDPAKPPTDTNGRPMPYYDPSTGSWVFNHDQWTDTVPVGKHVHAQIAPASHESPDDRERRIDLLRRYGVAIQDAALVCAPELLKPTLAIQCADQFLVGKGVVDDADGTDDDRSDVRGDERRAQPRKKTICIFAGPLGVGKTIAASYVLAHGRPQRIVGQWTSQDHPIFVHAQDVFAGSKLTGDKDEIKRRDLVRCKVLVIDDLGLEQDPRRTFQPYMDWLVNARYGGDGFLVLTTNLTAEEFRKRYGERIYDRLRHRACWYEIAHESLRGREG